MSVFSAIDTAGDLVSKVADMTAELNREVIAVQTQWAQLGKMGAQREDHGAALLKSIRAHIHALDTFCGNVDTQLGELIADPFKD